MGRNHLASQLHVASEEEEDGGSRVRVSGVEAGELEASELDSLLRHQLPQAFPLTWLTCGTSLTSQLLKIEQHFVGWGLPSFFGW